MTITETERPTADTADVSEDFIKEFEPRKRGVQFDWRRLLLFGGGLLVLVGLVLLTVALDRNGDDGRLVINEICTSNHGCLDAGALGTPDWVELYNGTSRTIDLEGYGLSDKIKDCYRYKFPAGVSIEPGAYLIVYCTGGSGAADQNVLTTDFGLDAKGCTLVLTGLHYGALDNVSVPALNADQSYARQADGSFALCDTPTPNAQNEG